MSETDRHAPKVIRRTLKIVGIRPKSLGVHLKQVDMRPKLLGVYLNGVRPNLTDVRKRFDEFAVSNGSRQALIGKYCPRRGFKLGLTPAADHCLFSDGDPDEYSSIT